MLFRFYLHLGNGRVIDIRSFRVVKSKASAARSELKKLN